MDLWMTDRNRYDVPFAVPCVHRVRFTQDVLGREQATLAELLEPGAGPGTLARVQIWLDEHVANARPELPARLRQFVSAHSDRIELAGNLQIVPGGEAIKNDIHILERMLKCMNAAELDRRSYVIVIGGGAVLDCVGFAAAIAHRGIRLVRLPTTTLAQADSGIGVKNSVNLFDKKNWIGTFATPWAVVNDQQLLSTLPDDDFRAGFSEAVKVSLLKDPAMFYHLCRIAPRIAARDMAAAAPVIRDSAVWHLRHITEGGDPFEALEARPLDFGHWSAHKLEVLTDFAVSHGAAVAIGVALDTVYSAMAHDLPLPDADRVLRCLLALGLPIDHDALHRDTIYTGLEEFRQHLGGRLTLTMLHGIGRPFEVHEINHTIMHAASDYITQFATQRG
ncbi:3-dehydroquinate synthase [Planctomycetales bacterium ZRK34]|nr:3-dehydroquinate synthase [Planctomycetales bacterium ZRK34]